MRTCREEDLDHLGLVVGLFGDRCVRGMKIRSGQRFLDPSHIRRWGRSQVFSRKVVVEWYVSST